MITTIDAFTLGLMELMLATAVVYFFPSRRGLVFHILYAVTWVALLFKVVWLILLAIYDIQDWTSTELSFLFKAIGIISVCGAILLYRVRRSEC